MPYFVSRQRYWSEGTPVVEVAAGGLDYANPDMLGFKYRAEGEGEEYTDPREAVEAAIAVCRAWRADGTRCHVATGATGGFTMPFEPTTFRDARAWAERAWERLPKCDGCGKPLPSEREQYRRLDDWTGERFCSERCCERAIEFDEQCDAEFAAQENAEDAE